MAYPENLAAPWSLVAASPARPGDEPPVTRSLGRIDAVDDALHAWVSVDRDAVGGDGPLAGVPVGVKDIVDVAGVPTRCGSATRRAAPPATADADLVARLRRLGAAPVGKTVTTEFAYFEPGPTRNPHASDHTPGGSSSGSAAAVAAGMVPLALGTQTAGSVVRPAAFCGVAGYATPRGVLSTAGVAPLAPSLDTVGLFAADLASVALVRAALDGVPTAPPPSRPRLWTWDGGAATEPPMAAAWSGLVARARAAGAELVGDVADLIDPDEMAALGRDHRTALTYEAARAIPAESRASGLLGRRIAEAVARGEQIPERTYRDALDHGTDARDRVLAALAEDPATTAILAPAAPGAAPHGLDSTGDPVMNAPWHLLGLPAVAVPGLRDGAGLPLGVALLGHPAWEHDLLALGAWLEAVITA